MQVCGVANIHRVEDLSHWQQRNNRRVCESRKLSHQFVIDIISSLRRSSNPLSPPPVYYTVTNLPPRMTHTGKRRSRQCTSFVGCSFARRGGRSASSAAMVPAHRHLAVHSSRGHRDCGMWAPAFAIDDCSSPIGWFQRAFTLVAAFPASPPTALCCRRFAPPCSSKQNSDKTHVIIGRNKKL